MNELKEQQERSLALLRNIVRFTSIKGLEYFDRRSSSDKIKPYCAVVTSERNDLVRKAIDTLDNGGKAKFNALNKDFEAQKEFSAFLIYKLGTAFLTIEKTGEIGENGNYEIYHEFNFIPECCPNRLNYVMQKASKFSDTTYKLTAL